MDNIIIELTKKLRIIYIIHIIIFSIILTFNFILLSELYWLKKIYKKLYYIGILISIIHFILPIISLILVFIKKIKKENIKIFNTFTIIFCIISIIFGFYFSGLLMMNTIESPEFCKECPFNLKLEDINIIIKSNELNKKCNERRCVINNNNINILQKNENDLYEYICNYDPTSEFEKVKETFDNEDKNNIINDNNNNNSSLIQNGDNIICNKIIKEDILLNFFENNYAFNFYDKCNIYTDFFLCERTKEPNKFSIEENFICPEKNYMTKVILFCMFNVLLNLIINFLLFKIEYNKYSEAILKYRPRINPNQKSKSLNSTINSSKINDENKETEQKFEPAPAEILIVCSNRRLTNVNKKDDNNNNINNENNEINKEKNNKNDLKYIEDDINIDLSLKKTKSKKINFHPAFSQIQNDKKKKNYNSGKNMRNDIDINKLKIMKNLREKENESINEQSNNKNISENETNNKIEGTFDDDNSINTKRKMVNKKNKIKNINIFN